MSSIQISRWCLAMLVVGCNAKLQVDPGAAGGAAGGGTAGDSGTAGRSGTAGNAGVPGGGDAGAGPVGEGGDDNVAGSAGNSAGYGGDFGGYGGNVVVPHPGDVNQPCIPAGSSTEADGTTAKAVIASSVHCSEGLACNSKNKCVPAPDCPQAAGVCVVRRAALGGSGGAGGASGIGGSGGADTGSGGFGNGTRATDEQGVTAMTSDASHVYWTEYGTRDALGNYLHDGAVMSFDVQAGSTTVLASGLEGAADIGVTSSHVYIYVDGAQMAGSDTKPQLLRAPLSGGAAVLVQDGSLIAHNSGRFLPPEAWFSADGDRAFWTGDNVYAMSATDTAPSVFLATLSNGLIADSTNLYFIGVSGSLDLSSVPLAGGAPQSLGLSGFPVVPNGTFLYKLQGDPSGSGVLLSRAPKAGGSLTRVRALGFGSPGLLRANGDQYFFESSPSQAGDASLRDSTKIDIVTASFTTSDPPIRLQTLKARHNALDHLWTGTPKALFWSDGQAIYSRPVSAN